MSNVYFIGDLHFGHEGIIRFRTEFRTGREHDDFISSNWNKTIQKNDLVYVVGDAAFTIEGLERVGSLNGRKRLVRGNHDILPIARYLVHFEDILGIFSYKSDGLRFWVSHAPVHPVELRNRINIHGHVHKNTVVVEHKTETTYYKGVDPWYWNVSAENIGYTPITIKAFNEIAVPTSRVPDPSRPKEVLPK